MRHLRLGGTACASSSGTRLKPNSDRPSASSRRSSGSLPPRSGLYGHSPLSPPPYAPISGAATRFVTSNRQRALGDLQASAGSNDQIHGPPGPEGDRRCGNGSGNVLSGASSSWTAESRTSVRFSGSRNPCSAHFPAWISSALRQRLLPERRHLPTRARIVEALRSLRTSGRFTTTWRSSTCKRSLHGRRRLKILGGRETRLQSQSAAQGRSQTRNGKS